MADIPSERRWYERYGDDGLADFYANEDAGRATAENARRLARAVGSSANALVNGAYSTLGNSYDAARAVGRGVGVLGREEFRRFGQEADLIGASLGQVGPALGQIGLVLGQIVEHPKLTAQAAGRFLAANPLLPFYFAGRVGMGSVTGLGPVAMAGGALRAVEDGHDLIDSLVQGGLLGTRVPGGLLDIPPEGRGLLGHPIAGAAIAI